MYGKPGSGISKGREERRQAWAARQRESASQAPRTSDPAPTGTPAESHVDGHAHGAHNPA